MSTRTKWLLLVFTLIGATLGLIVTLRAGMPVFRQEDALWQLKLIFFVALLLYGLGLVASLWFARKPARCGLLRCYYLFQIVAVSVPLMKYRFVSGAHLTPNLNLSSTRVGIGLDFWFGSIWNFQLFGESSWGLGINLVAVAILWLLRARPSAPPHAQPQAATDTTFAPLR